jgi:hypothetical protein
MGRKKKETRPIRIFTLDTETRGLFGEIFKAGLFDGENYWTSEHIEDLLTILRQSYSGYDCHVFVHNLDFDLSKMVKYVMKGAKLKDSIFINNSVVTFISNNITFHDSFRLLPSSLEKLCIDFGLGYGEGKMNLDDYIEENGYEDKTDFFMRVPADDIILNEYLQLDCTSLYKIVSITKEISGLSWEDFLKCPTVASLAMKVYSTLYADDFKEATSTITNGAWGELGESMSRAGYYGGRVEVFTPHMEDSFHYDVNSLYPYVMKVNTFPVGDFDILQDGRAEYQWHRWLKNRVGGGLIWCKIFIPDMHIPPLPKKYMGKLIFPIGKLEGVWTFEEVEMAIRYGCEIIDIVQVMYFRKRAPIFKAFITQMEEIKTTSKGAKRNFAKLMQNSLYGKFGMRREREALVDISEKKKLEEEKQTFFEIHNTILDVKFLRTKIKSFAKYIQVHIAAYVTAYARILLYESMMKVAKTGEVAYCDTDSMVMDGQLPDDMVDNNEYGKWKLEGVIKEGIFIQPKLYYERYENGEETFKAKGVPKKIVEDFTKETYTKILTAIRAGAESITIYEGLPARQKFGTALVQNKDFDLQLILKKKLNLSAGQKRIMDYENNISLPHRINDLEVEDNPDAFNNWLMEEYPEGSILWEQVKRDGYLKCVTKNERYYEEYKGLPKKVKMKYFRKEGTPLDVWAHDHDRNACELLEELKGVC